MTTATGTKAFTDFPASASTTVRHPTIQSAATGTVTYSGWKVIRRTDRMISPDAARNAWEAFPRPIRHDRPDNVHIAATTTKLAMTAW